MVFSSIKIRIISNKEQIQVCRRAWLPGLAPCRVLPGSARSSMLVEESSCCKMLLRNKSMLIWLYVGMCLVYYRLDTNLHLVRWTWIYSDNFTATSFLFNQYGRSQHLRMRARPGKVRDRGRGKQAHPTLYWRQGCFFKWMIGVIQVIGLGINPQAIVLAIILLCLWTLLGCTLQILNYVLYVWSTLLIVNSKHLLSSSKAQAVSACLVTWSRTLPSLARKCEIVHVGWRVKLL